jgi:membrane protein YqaA with SNARE-associated domain
MERKALVNISAAVVTAVISGLILYETLIANTLLEESGLAGIFFASMFSHLTVIGRDLFAPAFLSLALTTNPLFLGFSAGLGGAIGEVTTYYWGLGIKEALAERNEEDDVLSKWIEKYGLLSILIVAASPLPDTPIALLAGSARFPFRKFIIVEAIGKVGFYSVGAVVGSSIFGFLSSVMDELVLSMLVVVASIGLCVVASWSKSREKVLQLVRKVLP